MISGATIARIGEHAGVPAAATRVKLPLPSSAELVKSPKAAFDQSLSRPRVVDPGQIPSADVPPPILGTEFTAGKGAVTPPGMKPLSVVVSDDPTVRIQQAKSMFERNPAVWKLTGVGDAIRGSWLMKVPVVKGVLGRVLQDADVTRVGVGQAFVDQVRWQMRTGRQPQDAWWMTMNKRSLEDPLLAEAYVRAGRQDELTSPVLTAWVDFFEKSDAIARKLGVDPTRGYLGPGRITPGNLIPTAERADGPAGQLASLATRAKLLAWDFPRATRAYWKAHSLSIQEGAREFRPLLAESKRRHPTEGDLQEVWGRFIKVMPIASPLGAGSSAERIQKAILTQVYPAERESMSLAQKAFIEIARLVPKDKEPAAAAGPRLLQP